MPTCPKCGSTRVDRFCAFCGTAATTVIDRRQQATASPPPPPPPPLRQRPRKQSPVGVLIIVALIVGGVFAVTLMTVTHHSVVNTPLRPVPAMPVESGMARYLQNFDTEVSLRLTLSQASALAYSTDAGTDERLAELKAQVGEVANLRERLAAALRQARLEDRWPVGVAGVKFYRPAQLQAAVDSADVYLRRGAAAQAELVRVSDQNHRSTAEFNRCVAEMQRIRTDVHLAATGQLRVDMTTMREKHAQFIELAASLDNAARTHAEVDWKIADVPPFRLN